MSRIAFVSLIGFMAALRTAQGEGPPPAIIPFVDEATGLVVHMDLTKLDVAKTGQRLLGASAEKTRVGRSLISIATWTDAIRKAGGTEVNLLFQLDPEPRPPLVVVPLAVAADRPKLERVLTGRELGPSIASWPTTAVIHGAVVAGESRDLDRLRDARRKMSPTFIAEAMQEGGVGDIRIALTLSPAMRGLLERETNSLPPPIGGGGISGITRSLSWISIRAVLDPKAVLHISARAKTPGAARDLEHLLAATWKTFGDQLGAAVPAKVDPLEVNAEGDRLTSHIDVERLATILRPAIERQRLLANRMRCVNSLKQIVLAMHDYHGSMGSFPPAYRASTLGKPLLSWRVLILPYLGQQKLYNEFHLDEPWHSPHNKALITRIPDIFRCPDSDLPAGRTSYLAPRGKATLIPGPELIKIDDVTDGTSSTIAVVDAGADNAVVWTVPDDWEIDGGPVQPETILKSHPGGSNIGFADGSVRFLRSNITPEVFGALLTRNGGEVITADAF